VKLRVFQRAGDQRLGQPLGRLHRHAARAVADHLDIRQDEIEDAPGLVRAVAIEEVESRLVWCRIEGGHQRRVVSGRRLD
jgi:hypothetical protein